jgi:hypothetical protein
MRGNHRRLPRGRGVLVPLNCLRATSEAPAFAVGGLGAGGESRESFNSDGRLILWWRRDSLPAGAWGAVVVSGRGALGPQPLHLLEHLLRLLKDAQRVSSSGGEGDASTRK